MWVKNWILQADLDLYCFSNGSEIFKKLRTQCAYWVEYGMGGNLS